MVWWCGTCGKNYTSDEDIESASGTKRLPVTYTSNQKPSVAEAQGMSIPIIAPINALSNMPITHIQSVSGSLPRVETSCMLPAKKPQITVGFMKKKRPVPSPIIRPAHAPVIGRNDPCPCHSGKKFKHCCLKRRV